jgi:hypothetical protein
MSRNVLVLSLMTVMLAVAAYSQTPEKPAAKKSELGFALGWGSPVGAGVEYAYDITPAHNLGAGAGFSMSGARYALGYRYFFKPEKGATPYLGLALTGASGLSSVTVNVNKDSADYKIKSGVALAPRAGFRFRTRIIDWYVNTGYHIVLAGGGSEYVSGSTKRSLKDFADVVALGGLEVSGEMLFRF